MEKRSWGYVYKIEDESRPIALTNERGCLEGVPAWPTMCLLSSELCPCDLVSSAVCMVESGAWEGSAPCCQLVETFACGFIQELELEK